jgi:hypothetical protein
MAEVLFYHLQNQPARAVCIPTLLEKLARPRLEGVVVEAGESRGTRWLRSTTGISGPMRDESFLPHANLAAEQGRRGEQPVDPDHRRATIPNQASQVRFCDRRRPHLPDSIADAYRAPRPDVRRRRSTRRTAAARAAWTASKRDARRFAATYWQQRRTRPLAEESLTSSCCPQPLAAALAGCSVDMGIFHRIRRARHPLQQRLGPRLDAGGDC